jgi:hypothetical protein
MIVGPSGFRKGVSRYSKALRRVEVLPMPDAGQDTTQQVESGSGDPPNYDVLRLLAPSVAAGAHVDCC